MIQPAAPNKIVIGLLALLKFSIPLLFIHPAFELQRDEYLYYQQGQHLALGYLENPPLLSYLGWISSWFGNKEWLIRLWPALIGALTVIVTCLIAARLGGRSFAQFFAGLSLISGAFLRIHILFQPNILDIFFWTCSLYFLVRFIQTDKRKDLLLMAICLALSWWSKYSALFLIASIIIGLLFTKYRTVFIQKRFYIAVSIAILIVSPNVWWQYAHKWPLIHHMKELRETQLVHVNASDFIKEQFLILFPVLILWIAGLTWFFIKNNYRIFSWIYLSVILLLIFGSGKGYYALGVYPILLAAGGVVWEKLLWKRKWALYIICILIIGFTIPFIPIALPMMKPEKLAEFYKEKGVDKIGILKWEDQKDHPLPQDFADMLGWKELADKTVKFFNGNSNYAQANTIIFCRNYGQAGALPFFINDKYITDRVISDNGTFLLWRPDNVWFKNLIFIGAKMPGKDDEVFQHFKKVTVIDSVTNPLSRQFGDKIIYFETIDSTGLKLAQDDLVKMKKEFNR